MSAVMFPKMTRNEYIDQLRDEFDCYRPGDALGDSLLTILFDHFRELKFDEAELLRGVRKLVEQWIWDAAPQHYSGPKTGAKCLVRDVKKTCLFFARSDIRELKLKQSQIERINTYGRVNWSHFVLTKRLGAAAQKKACKKGRDLFTPAQINLFKNIGFGIEKKYRDLDYPITDYQFSVIDENVYKYIIATARWDVPGLWLYNTPRPVDLQTRRRILIKDTHYV